MKNTFLSRKLDRFCRFDYFWLQHNCYFCNCYFAATRHKVNSFDYHFWLFIEPSHKKLQIFKLNYLFLETEVNVLFFFKKINIKSDAKQLFLLVFSLKCLQLSKFYQKSRVTSIIAYLWLPWTRMTQNRIFNYLKTPKKILNQSLFYFFSFFHFFSFLFKSQTNAKITLL